MTLQEAKEQVAKKYAVDIYNLTVWMSDESAELYARSKWDEACEAQMKEVYNNILPGRSTNANAIQHWTKKPEFKP